MNSSISIIVLSSKTKCQEEISGIPCPHCRFNVMYAFYFNPGKSGMFHKLDIIVVCREESQNVQAGFCSHFRKICFLQSEDHSLQFVVNLLVHLIIPIFQSVVVHSTLDL